MEKFKRTIFYVTVAEEDIITRGAYRERKSDEYELASEWAKWWMYHLSKNEDYKKYCEAKRTGDVVVCDEIECKFPKISLIYEDVGELVFTVLHPGWQWDAWFDSHIDLFVPQAAEVEIIEQDDYDKSVHTSHRVLKVPLGLSSKEAKKMFAKFSDEFYGKGNENLREPKYQIYKASNCSLEPIKRAVMVHIAMSTSDGDRENTSAAEAAIILALLSKPTNAHFLTKDEYADLDEYNYFRGQITVPLDPKSGAVIQAPKSTDFPDQLKNFRRLTRAYRYRVENTLHGIFPCDEPITSN